MAMLALSLLSTALVLPHAARVKVVRPHTSMCEGASAEQSVEELRADLSALEAFIKEKRSYASRNGATKERMDEIFAAEAELEEKTAQLVELTGAPAKLSAMGRCRASRCVCTLRSFPEPPPTVPRLRRQVAAALDGPFRSDERKLRPEGEVGRDAGHSGLVALLTSPNHAACRGAGQPVGARRARAARRYGPHVRARGSVRSELARAREACGPIAYSLMRV